MLHVERSIEVARSITVERKACWSNAFTAFLVNTQLQSGQYVEGWAIPEMDDLRLNLEHGWIEAADGSIIDLVIDLKVRRKMSVGKPGVEHSGQKNVR